jgi:hypothetical protein
MSDGYRPRGEPELDRGDAELVRQIAAAYRPPDPAPSARAVFRAGVDARIRRRTAGRRWALGAATVAAAAAFVVLRGPAPVAPVAGESSSDAAAEEALLAIAAPEDAEEQTLPADYEAIEGLFLEGEGV